MFTFIFTQKKEMEAEEKKEKTFCLLKKSINLVSQVSLIFSFSKTPTSSRGPMLESKKREDRCTNTLKKRSRCRNL